MSAVRVVWQLATAQDAADRLLADEVSDVLGCAPAEVGVGRSCAQCGSREHGRPVVVTDAVEQPPYVSLARAAGVVVVAVCTEHPVGVDVERHDQAWPPGSADLLLHPGDPAGSAKDLTTSWVRKEALLKASGDGLRVEPSTLRMTAPWEEPRLLEWPGGPAVPTAQRDLQIEGYLACVAVLGQDAVWVTQRQATAEAPSRGAMPRTGPRGPGGPGPRRAR